MKLRKNVIKLLPRIVLAFLIIVVSNRSYAQIMQSEINITGTIYGHVQNMGNNAPVEYATIALYSLIEKDQFYGTVTDIMGDFVLNNLPVGLYDLEVSFVGFKKSRINRILIKPQESERYLGNIKLEPDFKEVEGVTVVGEKSEMTYKTDKLVVNVEQNLIAKGGSVIDALENVPSVKTDMEGNLTLRGSSNYVVLIDGNPSALKGSDALQQIPSNNVASVEIITSPSAKYDSEGEVGIINVITKKGFSDGLNGIANGSIGSNTSYSSDFAMNYTKNKLSFSIGLDTKNNPIEGNGLMEKEMFSEGKSLLTISDMDMSLSREKTGVNSGLVYSINNRNNLNWDVDLGRHTFDRVYASSIDYISDTIEYSGSESTNKKEEQFVNSSFHYQHLFNLNGHKIDALVYLSTTTNNQDDNVVENSVDASGLPDITSLTQHTTEEGKSNEIHVKVDYSQPIKNNKKLEAGYQNRLESTSLKQDYLYKETDLVTIDDKNNVGINREIFAMYGLFSGQIEKIDYQFGLRTEYTQREVSQSSDINLSKEYIDLFPTFHLSYLKGEGTQLQLSYSRRINRPDMNYLNPFIEIVDNNNQRQGNPSLSSEYINAFELNYLKRVYLSVFSAELFYRQTNNKISPVWSLEEDNVLLLSYENLKQDYAAGCELMLVSPVKEWLRVMLNTSLYRYNVQGSAAGLDVNNTSNTFSVRMGTTFKIKKSNTRLQINGMYNGDKAGAQGSRESFFAVMAAINQDIIPNKLSASVLVKDVFSTIKFSTYSESEYFNSSMQFEPNTPLISFNLSYKFNKYKKSTKALHDVNEYDFGDDFIY